MYLGHALFNRVGEINLVQFGKNAIFSQNQQAEKLKSREMKEG